MGCTKQVVSFNQVAELTKSSLSIGTAPNSFSMTANLSFFEEITPIAFMYGSECWDSLMKGNFCWMRIWMHKSILVIDFNPIKKYSSNRIIFSGRNEHIRIMKPPPNFFQCPLAGDVVSLPYFPCEKKELIRSFTHSMI